MKASSKPKPKFKPVYGGSDNVPDLRQTCQEEGCKARFTTKPYRTGPDLTLCPKHRAEFKEKEADAMAAAIEAKQKATADGWL